MSSLLSKFQAVTIQNDTRISTKDTEFCKYHESMYEAAKEMLNKQIKLLMNLIRLNSVNDNTYYNFSHMESDIKELEKRIDKKKKDIVYNIVQYFRKQYNVSLETAEINSKFKSDITYNNILDEIFVQLDGFNFAEKAIKEIKEASRETVYRDDKIKINKGKVIIADYIYWHDGWNGKRLSYNDTKVTPLFTALSYFETGDTKLLFYYSAIYNELYTGSEKHDIFSKYELGYNKVKSIKNYKNGKIEIEFQTNTDAQSFVNDYLIG